MSGRESTVFSFSVDEWINELLGRFKMQLKNHSEKLGLQIEQSVLQTSATTLSSMSDTQKRLFKTNLRGDVAKVRQTSPKRGIFMKSTVASTLSQFLEEAFTAQSQILDKYLREHVFFVPPDAILSISPLDVPIPSSSIDTTIGKDYEAELKEKISNEPGKSKNGEVDASDSLRAVLLQIHKTEYFLSRLKVLYSENEQHLQALQNILHSLLQLDEITKANDTESAIHQMLETLKSSFLTLKSIDNELQKRGVNASLHLS